jgi:hypothetical protein
MSPLCPIASVIAPLRIILNGWSEDSVIYISIGRSDLRDTPGAPL